MKFLSLEMNNWLIFKGRQDLLFPQDDYANILIIFGENNTGKTSLFNGVMWALYGEIFDCRSRLVPNNTLLNTKASRDGENSFSVKLKIESEGKSYEIFRESKVVGATTTDQVILKEDNRVQDGAVAESIIEGLSPKQISQFLLFDGELLNEFENLVTEEDGDQAREIKKNIEKALGLPVLGRASQELYILQKKISKVVQSEMKKSNNLQNLVRNLDIHENDLTSKNKEIESIESQMVEQNIRIRELEAILEGSNKSVALSEEKKLLQTETACNKEELKILGDDLKSSYSNLWREPLSGALAPYVEKIESEISILMEKQRSAVVASGQVDDLEKAITDEVCSHCGNVLDPDELVKIQTKLEKLKSSAERPEDLNNQITSLHQRLSGITVSGVKIGELVTIQSLSNQKSNLSRRNIAIENRLYNIKNDLADFDEEQGRKTGKEFRMRTKETIRLSQVLFGIESDIEKIEIEISKIKKNPDYISEREKSGSNTSGQTCESLLTIFKAAISKYRDSMRAKVGERASDTFRHLTTEEQFDYLKINESYGLDLIIGGDKITRSAGVEQIVALSLIEALNHLGRRKGPMLMDTPAGRLDKSHRKNIANYLPTVVTQLALFVHSGEFTEDDIYFDRSRIGKKYKIKRFGIHHAELQETL